MPSKKKQMIDEQINTFVLAFMGEYINVVLPDGYNEHGPLSFTIYNMMGARIALPEAIQVRKGLYKLDVRELSPGIYILESDGSAGSRVVKFEISR